MPILSSKKHYLQVALNSNLTSAMQVMSSLPRSDRILIEVGTPLIKEFGANAIRQIHSYWNTHLNGFMGLAAVNLRQFTGGQLSFGAQRQTEHKSTGRINPYIVADLKCMDRATTEVSIAKLAGASAAVVLGIAPIETVREFIKACKASGMDSMIDMMNVDRPYKVLRQLQELPDVVILHRGVDETDFSDKPLPIHMINKIKGAYDVMISIAGGDTSREVQSAIFNGADIVVLWKDFYMASSKTASITNDFLLQVK